MTNQDAIYILSGLRKSLHEYCGLNDNAHKAFDMAISALQAQELKQEVKNSNESSLTQNALDTISRQEAIDAIGKASDELYENIKKGATFPQRQWFDGMAQAQSILENLPSVHQEINCSGIPNTSDFVSRKAVREMVATWAYDLMQEDLNMALHDVDELPPEQTEVIHCKDCKHRDPEDKKCDSGHAIQWQLPRSDDWFCADAERKQK